MTLKKLLLGLFILIISLIVGGVGVLFYTRLPLQGLADGLAKAGFITEGLDGSLASGLTIQSANAEGNSARFVLKNFSFKYSGLYDLFVNRHLHIRTLTLDELEYFRKNPQPASDTKKDTKADSSNEGIRTSSSSSGTGNLGEVFKKVTIDEIRIGRVAFILDGALTPSTFVLNRFEVDAAELSGGKSKFKRVTIDSNYLSFEVIPENEGTEGFQVSGIMKAVLSPYLLQDFPWKGALAIQNHQLKDLALDAFDGQLQVKKVGENLQIALKEVFPEKFFRDTFPVTSVNGNLTWSGIQTPDLRNLTSAGTTIRLGQTVFAVPDGILMQKIPGENGGPDHYGFSATGGMPAQPYVFGFRMKDSVKKDDPSSYAFSLSSVTPMRADNLIAAVYFGKPFGKLIPQEVATVQKAASFFNLTLPPPAPIAVKRSVPVKSPARRLAPRQKARR